MPDKSHHTHHSHLSSHITRRHSSQHQLDPDELTELPPLPVENPDELVKLPDFQEPPKPNPLFQASTYIPGLKLTQKLSAYGFLTFLTAHTASVTVAPLVSERVGNQTMQFFRAGYQAPSVEPFLILGAVGTHVLAGMALRLIRQYRRRKLYGPRMKLPDEADDVRPLERDASGLGGITALLGLGTRPAWVYRKLGLSPLAFSGYSLLFFLTIHIYATRIIPLLVDGSSAFVSLSYVSHALNNYTPLAWAKFIGLCLAASYHSVSGLAKFLGIGKQHTGKLYAGIGVLFSLYMAGLLKIRSFRSGPFGKQFDLYLTYLI